MQTSLLKLLRPLFVLLLLVPAGCAKSPAGGGTSPVSGPQLIISMTVNGTIDPHYYYYILFNVNGNEQIKNPKGPIPSYFPPYGNGFAAGSFTNYVEYSGSQGNSSNFDYYAITPDLLTPIPLGQSHLVSPQTDGKTLSFQLPLAYLATTNVSAENIQDIEINFVTTNIVPLPTDNLFPNKAFDALYQTNQIGSNSKYVTLIVRNIPGGPVQSSINLNSTLNIEHTGDVAVSDGSGNPQTAVDTAGLTTANLDISDFKIQLAAQ